MNTAPAPAAEAAPTPRFALHTNRRCLIVGLILALIVIGGVLLALRPVPAAPQALPQLPREVAVQPFLAVPAPDPVSMPDPVSAPRLHQLEERVDALHQSVDAVTSQLREVTTRLVALGDQTEALRGRVDGLAARPAPAPQRTAAPKAAKAPKPRMPAVVSIDTWGSAPSAAIRDLEGSLAFYREGDTVGLARIQRIDAHAREVHLRLPDGTSAIVGVQP